jgi:hypothetical protein
MMRLKKLNTEYRLKHKLLLRVIALVSGRQVPDVFRLYCYRHAFFGKHAARLAQSALRGPSEWSIFERELMAAFVSSLNQCVF